MRGLPQNSGYNRIIEAKPFIVGEIRCRHYILVQASGGHGPESGISVRFLLPLIRFRRRYRRSLAKSYRPGEKQQKDKNQVPGHLSVSPCPAIMAESMI